MSKINFFVTVPINTPQEEDVCITGNGDMLGNWEPGIIKLSEIGDKLYHIELEIPEHTEVEFKFTRGTWLSVETGKDFVYIPNRKLFVNSHTDLYLNIENWEDLPDAGEAHTLTGNFRIHRNFHSTHMVDTRTVMVYLPPGYAYEGDHYPVLYLHDGQNVFDASTSYGGVEWRVDEAAESLIKEGKIKKLIIAGIYNDRDRDNEYTPSVDPEEGTGGGAENYAKFIIEEVKPFIDSNYRTLPDAENTAIMGSSLGGSALFI